VWCCSQSEIERRSKHKFGKFESGSRVWFECSGPRVCLAARYSSLNITYCWPMLNDGCSLLASAPCTDLFPRLFLNWNVLAGNWDQVPFKIYLSYYNLTMWQCDPTPTHTLSDEHTLPHPHSTTSYLCACLRRCRNYCQTSAHLQASVSHQCARSGRCHSAHREVYRLTIWVEISCLVAETRLHDRVPHPVCK
jgi:hypothetical protein